MQLREQQSLERQRGVRPEPMPMSQTMVNFCSSQVQESALSSTNFEMRDRAFAASSLGSGAEPAQIGTMPPYDPAAQGASARLRMPPSPSALPSPSAPPALLQRGGSPMPPQLAGGYGSGSGSGSHL